jgi:DNA-binding winged helix-turn-helix (wHTH) protein
VQGDFRIDDWLIQPQINSVEKEGKTWHLEPKVMQVLLHLASHPNEVLSKDRLLEAVWHNTFVGDDVLVRCISEIRYVFGDDPKSSRVIQTIPKGGYRLIAPVTPEVQTNIEPAKLVTARPETVFRYNLELEHEKESHVAVVDEPHSHITNWLPGSEDEQTAHPVIVVDQSHRSRAVNDSVRVSASSNRHFWSIVAGASVIVLLGCLAAIYAWKSTHKSTFDFFWGPVVNTNEPVLICIADQNQYGAVALRDSADPTRQILLKDNLTAVVIDDLNAVIQITGILKSNDKQYSLKGEGATNLTDLRNGPTVFVGAFDNAWTLRLTNPLRYHFANNPEMTQFRIVDSESPSQTNWGINRVEQMATNNYRDYAIVARFTDGNTGKLAIIIAGVGRGGTIAAGELVTNPTYLAQLSNAAHASGNKKNMEIVLSTQIIDGQPGSPKIEAAYFW